MAAPGRVAAHATALRQWHPSSPVRVSSAALRVACLTAAAVGRPEASWSAGGRLMAAASGVRMASSAGRRIQPGSRVRPRTNAQQQEVSTSNYTFLLPSTLVTPPFWRWPRSPSKFLHFTYLTARNRLLALYALVSFKVLSKPSLLARPVFKLRKGAIVPAAKSLHVRMNEAIARGDKETLRAICTAELYQKLASTIDHRPLGQRTEWELVKYDNSPAYPRLVDDKASILPLPGGNRMCRQAVVSISSVQRLVRYDDNNGGAKVAGSEKVTKVVEHLVLSSNINQQTWAATPWVIWGTLPESTYEDYVAELAAEKALQQ